MIEIKRYFSKPKLIGNVKIKLPGIHYPHFLVNNKQFYSKYYAMKECVETGVEWPIFKVLPNENSYHRPKINFHGSCIKECQIISDTSKKVRLWYSGGRDSHHILVHLLKTKSKLDEICAYRRFPAVIDSGTNEYDRFNVIEILKKTLNSYNKKVKIIIYDVLPEHFAHWSDNLETEYFPYTKNSIIAHTLHPLAEIYPEIMDLDYVNIIGNTPPCTIGNKFYWLDVNFNSAFNDPNVCHFFCDTRNMDLIVNQAYQMYDQKSNRHDLLKKNLNFYSNNSPLDNKNKGLVSTALFTNKPNWVWDIKDMYLHLNFVKTEQGINTLKKFLSFYNSIEDKYKRFFENGSIYHYWIGSISEKHTLLDTETDGGVMRPSNTREN